MIQVRPGFLEAEHSSRGDGDAFDAEGRPLLFATQPLGYYCASCVAGQGVPYGARLIGSRRRGDGVAGRCDACGDLGPEPAPLSCTELLDLVQEGLLLSPQAEAEDVWAERVRCGDGGLALRVHVGAALFVCSLRRVR